MTLRQRRKELGLSLEEAAVMLGVHFTTLGKWERFHVPAERVPRVSEILGIDRHNLRPDLYPVASDRAA